MFIAIRNVRWWLHGVSVIPCSLDSLMYNAYYIIIVIHSAAALSVAACIYAHLQSAQKAISNDGLQGSTRCLRPP